MLQETETGETGGPQSRHKLEVQKLQQYYMNV